MKKPLSFDPIQNTKQIVVVGLGGTGASLARSIARIVYHMRRVDHHVPNLIFIDPDKVEDKNVGRQMFTEADVGHNKAEILARRFNYALGLSVEAIPEPVNATKHFDRFYSGSTLLVGAVDNHRARCELAEVDATWLDCGNHRNAGQVVLGNTARIERVREGLKAASKAKAADRRLRHLPKPSLVFPQLLQPESGDAGEDKADLSCAELMARQEQHLLVNDMMANIAAQYVYKLLLQQPITTFITFVDADGLNMRSVPITPEELRPYLN